MSTVETRPARNNRWRIAAPAPRTPAPFVLGPLVLVTLLLFAACGSEQLPAAGRPDFPQPTFVQVEVTRAPESPTATPWPNVRDDGVRLLPEGLDPERYSPAEPAEVVALWTRFLTGTAMAASSDNFYFRGRPRFNGTLSLCPGGTGYLQGDPEGLAAWQVNASAGAWYEVTLTHEIPFTGDTATFALGIFEGNPVRSGTTDPIEFTDSDRCDLSEPGIQTSSTAAGRRLGQNAELTRTVVERIPWVDGRRELPAVLTAGGGRQELGPQAGIDYWYAYLTGGVLETVEYNYSSRSIARAFTGSLHLCDQRVAVLDGEPSGTGEWAVQSTGPKPSDVKIVFTLPADPAFRTIVLGVSRGVPVRYGRSADLGLIEATQLEMVKSKVCE